MQDSVGYGRIYRITPKGKDLKALKIDLKSTEGLTDALMNPAIHVRAFAFDLLKLKGEEAIPAVARLLTSTNPYHRARAIWLLTQLGESGKARVRTLLDHSDELIRATAFRALRQLESDIFPYAEKLSGDSSAFVRREVAIALRDLPFDRAA
jgi:HEAT repeat protein